MIVIQFREDFLHDGLAEEGGLCADAELVTILLDGSHFAVIQIDDLSVLADKGLLLLLDVFRIDSRPAYFLLACHCRI